MILISIHSMSFMSPLIYAFGYASNFREYSDCFYCIASGLLNLGNAILIALKRPTIFQLIDDFEEAVTKSKFWF